MKETGPRNIAEIAANFEDKFDKIASAGVNSLGSSYDITIKGETTTYTIIDVFDFGNGNDKAVALKDNQGNIYVHFNGTGDGNWQYNSVAYGGGPSDMQKKSLEWFNRVMEKHVEGKSARNLYVSGHSQGGNNAQYVTMRSPYADYITNCISLDGPGFSKKFVEDSINLYGEAFYNRQREKIWGYYGTYDYVSCLGEVSIVPKDQIWFVEYTKPDNKEMDFVNYHAAPGLINKATGELGELKEEDSAFRRYVVQALEKVKDLPDGQRERAAFLAMKIAEDLGGCQVDGVVVSNVYANLSADEFEELKDMLAPLLLEILADRPENIAPALEALGLDKNSAESVQKLIEHINSYPEDVRENVIRSILDGVVYQYDEQKGEYKIDYDMSKLPKAVLDALPIIVEAALTHPGDLATVLGELHLEKKIVNWIKENPWKFAGVCIVVVLFPKAVAAVVGLAGKVVKLIALYGAIADVFIRIIQTAEEIVGHIKHALTNLLTALKNTVHAIVQWARNTFNAGVRYVQNNPYFKADTAKLRNYATRINNVNNRLRNLDSGLRSLYWQVGFLDLWDILCANMLTSGSPTLNQVKGYLNNAADRLETAENTAYRYIGG